MSTQNNRNQGHQSYNDNRSEQRRSDGQFAIANSGGLNNLGQTTNSSKNAQSDQQDMNMEVEQREREQDQNPPPFINDKFQEIIEKVEKVDKTLKQIKKQKKKHKQQKPRRLYNVLSLKEQTAQVFSCWWWKNNEIIQETNNNAQQETNNAQYQLEENVDSIFQEAQQSISEDSESSSGSLVLVKEKQLKKLKSALVIEKVSRGFEELAQQSRRVAQVWNPNN